MQSIAGGGLLVVLLELRVRGSASAIHGAPPNYLTTMNASELNERSIYLRRLADQIDNLALDQIAIDNRRSELLQDLSRFVPTTVNKPTEKLESAPYVKRKSVINYANPKSRVCVAILKQFKTKHPTPLHRGDIVADIGTESISFYLSSLKYHGLINNPTRGFWTLTEKGIKA